jgi:hypothetical protein
MIEAQTVSLEALVEGALAGVAEGRMSNVMDESERFGEVYVEA